MSTELALIIDDDTSGAFTYAGGTWTLSTLVQWYQGTSWWPAFAITGTDFGSFTMNFEGTSVAFIGNTPQIGLSQSATVSIDGGAPYTISYGGSPPYYMQWYQTPVLADGKHTINVGHLATTSVDYAVVKVGPKTSLTGKTVIVDNTSPDITYAGGWKQDMNPFNAGTLPDGLPYGNSTHRSANVGDTISSRFTGTSTSVYGIFSWATLGTLSATYALDGGDAQSQVYSVTSSSPQFVKDDGEAVNFLLFSVENIPAGDHTLVINITQCVNQTFIFDYITYTPSFSTLSAMPNLSPPSAPASGTVSSPTTKTSTHATGSGSSLPAGSQGKQGSDNASATGASKSTPTGAIIGGVLGGLLLLALLALFLLWRRKNPTKVEDETRDEPRFNNDPSVLARSQNTLSPLQRGFGPSLGTVSPFQSLDPPAHYGFAADVKRERADSNEFPRSSTTSPITRSSRGAIASSNIDSGTEHSTSPELAHPPSYDALSSHHP